MAMALSAFTFCSLLPALLAFAPVSLKRSAPSQIHEAQGGCNALRYPPVKACTKQLPIWVRVERPPSPMGEWVGWGHVEASGKPIHRA